MRRFLMLCAERPWWVLSLLLAFSLLAATQLDRVEVRISTDELLLIDDPERAYYEEISQQFGDEQFQARVQRLMDAEQQTLAKRFGRVATA